MKKLIVDTDGKINEWPVMPSIIDYTQNDSSSGLIQNSERLPFITKDSLIKMNVSSGKDKTILGYHVIEFLLWGEDNGIVGSGGRSFEDYDKSENNCVVTCTLELEGCP